IAVNGVCLTAIEINKIGSKILLTMDVMPETFARSNLGVLKIGEKINVERALKLESRLNGHIVQGHVEEIGKVKNIKIKGNAKIFSIKVSDKILRNIKEKGSIAIDGISLTVAGKNRDCFEVSIIPETFMKTNLHTRKIGNFVNIETDYLLKKDDTNINTKKELTYKLLKEEGFM
ncbi:riboflavin synthase, partial [bacterium]